MENRDVFRKQSIHASVVWYQHLFAPHQPHWSSLWSSPTVNSVSACRSWQSAQMATASSSCSYGICSPPCADTTSYYSLHRPSCTARLPRCRRWNQHCKLCTSLKFGDQIVQACGRPSGSDSQRGNSNPRFGQYWGKSQHKYNLFFTFYPTLQAVI